MRLNQPVGLLNDWPILAARGGWSDRDEIDGSVRQSCMDGLDELDIPFLDCLGRLGLGPGNIIRTRKKHHRAGAIREYDLIYIVGDLFDLGPAETTIDNRERSHIIF